MKNSYNPLIYISILSLVILFSGCDLIAGIFEAGVWVGILISIVVLVVLIIIVIKILKALKK